MSALRRFLDSSWFPTLWMVTVILAWVVWAWNPSLGWPVAVAAAPMALPLLAGRWPFRPALLTVLLLLFLLTAGVGLWAGYDRDGSRAVFSNPIGWQKLWGLLLAVLFFYALAAAKAPAVQRRALALLVGFGAVVAVVFITTHDWIAEPAKWAPITRLGEALQSPLPALPGGFVNSNVTGGILAPLLPLSLGLAGQARRERVRLWVAWGLLSGGFLALGVLLTTSRGAWVGLAGGLALAAAWWLAGWLGRKKRRLALFAAVLVLGLLAGGSVLALVPPLRAAALESEAPVNRLDIFSQAALLVRDTPFTGSGLGNFPLVHSTYALLIHVPILSHAHALLLDVAVEQGLLGALAVAAAWGVIGWLGLRELARAEQPQALLAGGLLSLAVLVTHGLADDVPYGSRGVLLLWAPAGLIVAALPRREAGQRASHRWRWSAAGALLVALLGVFWRPLTAAWYANLGAMSQESVELPRYDYNRFDDPTLDQIRQREDLAQAEAYFDRALALDRGQVTARTRLTEIALGRGEYEVALDHVQAAWEAGHRDRVTRLLLGDALVAQGRVEEAAVVVQALAWAQDRLNGQAWYRYWLGEDWQRAAYAWRAALILNPQDAYAGSWVERAEERAAQEP